MKAFDKPNARRSKSFSLSQALSLFLSLACPLPPSLPSSLSLPLLAYQERNARRGVHLLVLVLFAAGESGCRAFNSHPWLRGRGCVCARVLLLRPERPGDTNRRSRTVLAFLKRLLITCACSSVCVARALPVHDIEHRFSFPQSFSRPAGLGLVCVAWVQPTHTAKSFGRTCHLRCLLISLAINSALDLAALSSFSGASVLGSLLEMSVKALSIDAPSSINNIIGSC